MHLGTGVVMVGLMLAGPAWAQRASLLAPAERDARVKLLVETRPSLAGGIALLTTGGILATGGTAASGFALILLAVSGGDAVVRGFLFPMAAGFGLPGLAAITIGIALMRLGGNRIRDHVVAGDEVDALRPHSPRAYPPVTG